VPDLSVDINAQLEQLERELNEIGLLLQQTKNEAERQEARRQQAEERLIALERDPVGAGPALLEAHAQLVLLTRRAAVMEGQLQVLEGKEKSLRRFQEFLTQALPSWPSPTDGGGAATDGGEGAPEFEAPSSRSVMAAQEELRREIARQMHDGPAQSIANIALQAQIVQRLMQRQPEQAEAELGRLGEMVQNALDATKTFIFEVRPMVLDDLGLVATLRRATLEETRRSGVPIRFETVGPDRRLGTEMESGLFRILNEAVTAYIATKPAELVLRLDWSPDELRAALTSVQTETQPVEVREMRPPSLDEEADLPRGLAGVMRDQQDYAASQQQARDRASALPVATWQHIRARAEGLGLGVQLEEGGKVLLVTFGPSL
jgi:two-component system, NarL family, sensor histidine kinase DegS